MEWFYAAGDKQNGPVSNEDFKKLAAEGTIRPETLVWRAGMDNWRPYREVTAAATAPGQPPLQMASAPADSAPGSAPAAGSVVCRECGQIFPPEDVVKLGDAFICATCKPIYVQRLREGGLQPGTLEYAGFWIRLGAKIIDGMIIGIPMMILFFIFLFPMITSGQSPEQFGFMLQFGIQVISYAISGIYTIFFNGRYGATPGKMACKLRVVAADGQPIGYGRATGRFFAEILSGIICNIGYIIAAFDDQKRSLHDHICSTRVIRK